METADEARSESLQESDAVVKHKPCPENNANLFSRIFLTWVFPLVLSGWRNPLKDEDLWELPDKERGVGNTNDLISEWKVRDEKGGNNRLSRALLKNNRRILTFTFVLKAMTTTLNLVQPIFVNRVINFIQEGRGKAPIGVGIGWALSLLFAPLLFTIAENQYFLGAFRAGMRVRAGVQGIIYDKSLRMSPSARAGSSLGEIVNLMQLDSQRVGDFMQFLHILWSAPIQLIVSFALLFYYLEWSAVVGLVVTILTFPLQGKLMQVQIRLRKKSLGITDRRVKLMNEILQGIKAVKFYAWEEPFGAQVEKERKEEVENFSKTIWARSLFMAVMLSIPSIIAVVTFSFYAGVFKKRLIPDTVFTGVVVLNTLRQPVMLLPMVVNFLIDARLSIKRIERFLDLDNTDDYARQSSTDSNSKNNGIDTDEASSSESQNGDGAEHHETSSSDSSTKVSRRGKKSGSGRITITDASFSWGTPGPSIAEVTSSGKSKSPMNCFGKKKRHEGSPSVKEEKNIEDASPGTGDATDGQDPSEAGALMVLQNISLDLSPGQLTAVIGRVGAGKSSLVQAILGEMQKATGEVKLEGSVAYVAQSAWIFNSTLKENILFGKPYNERLYRRALRVSALDADIAILPAGDMTAIGEKGINLSGGQKQRVSIARAVYADADVYLFDDPLSALDSHVSQEVFDNCLSNKGVLRNKLRLLVTNQVHVLGDCDTIVFLENGRIRNMGPYKYLAKSDSSFQQLIDEQSKKENDKEAENQTGQSIEEGAIDENSHAMQTSQSITEGQAGSVSINPESVQKDKHQTDEAKAGMKLIEEEDRKTGNIVANAYYQYAIACGGLIGFSVLMVFWAATVALQVIGQWWLAYWTTEQTRGIDRGLGFYLGIYFALAIGYAILATLRSVWYLTVALYASKRLHKKMLGSVLHAPMSFFDTTPIGRIISRFSRDVQAVDELLPQFFSQMLTTVLNLIASYIYIGAALPPFFAVAVPVTIGYWGLQRFFNRTSLEVKRLDNISKSPIYAHFSETLSGLSTLRAYRKQDEYRAQNMEMIDINQRAFFAYVASNRWFSLYLELLGALLIFATALFGVVLRDSTQNVALIGLALSYALQVTGILGFSVRSITELEAQMSSVERLNHYAENLPQEAKAIVNHDDLSDDDRPPQGWPAQGSVNIEDVEMRYREGLDLVLKGVSVDIKGGEKVGVVGRTGSGKSSLMVAILRLVELAGGTVRIDGVNLANLGLDEVRKTVTIIPQDAVLFSGTVRFNLDPFGHYSEPELWDALAKSHLKDFVQDFEGGLDAVVAEYGENLSAGQRQLICLTRALLRKSKVLILDEASSSLDMETDRLIQETIRLHLKDATILTIAHRLFTLADYDKILVMDDGSVAEFGTPADLLAKKESRFSAFVNALGEEGARRFHELVASSAHE